MSEQNNKTVELNEIPQKKLKDLLEFTCDFTFKVVGKSRSDLVDDVVKVVEKHAKIKSKPEEKPSSKGTYNSVSIKILAENIQQVETLYEELARIDGVRMVL